MKITILPETKPGMIKALHKRIMKLQRKSPIKRSNTYGIQTGVKCSCGHLLSNHQTAYNDVDHYIYFSQCKICECEAGH
jgi:hypothetical protein